MELMQITAGRGPIECSWVVPLVSKKIISEAKKLGIETSIVYQEEDYEKKTYKSMLLSVTGKETEKFIESWVGSIQWIAKSPFRPHHKRKNWFVSVNKLDVITSKTYDEKDIKIETMRSSGAGGQHTNKTESGVRATHIPTKTSVMITAERNQHRNKSIAIAILMSRLEEQNQKRMKVNEKDNWQNHNELIRGNPIKVFRS